MKRQVLLIHGGQVYENYEAYIQDLSSFTLDPKSDKKKWRMSLAESLGEDHEVFLPEMPNKMNAKYAEWKIWFEKYIPFFKNDLILVGHSLGASFLLRYLSEAILPIQVAKVCLVSSPFFSEDSKEGGDFRFDESRLSSIRNTVRQIVLFHSTDDKVVSFSDFERLKDVFVDAKTYVFRDRGHFLQEEFPELVREIKGGGVN